MRLHVFLTALFSPLLRPSCVRLVVRVSFTGRRLAALFFIIIIFLIFQMRNVEEEEGENARHDGMPQT